MHMIQRLVSAHDADFDFSGLDAVCGITYNKLLIKAKLTLKMAFYEYTTDNLKQGFLLAAGLIDL